MADISPISKPGSGVIGEQVSAAPPAAPASEAAPKRRRYLYFALGMAAFVILADQLSKLWVRSNINPWESVPAEGVFRLTQVQNTGSAFGLFPSQTVMLTIISIIAILGLFLALRYRLLRNAWASLSLGLLLGGSLGNLADRVRLGYVTDFIDIGLKDGWRFYTFNVADSAITVGAIVMAVAVLRMDKASTRRGATRGQQ